MMDNKRAQVHNTKEDRVSDVKTPEFFKDYRENVPNAGVSRSTYFKVIKSLGLALRREILKGHKVHLPFVGSIRIEKFRAKPKFAGFDYKTYNQTGEKVPRYRKDILDPYHPKIKWFKHSMGRYKYCTFLLPHLDMKELIHNFQDKDFNSAFVETI